ncbi:MAG: ACT domain-containing protein [Micrococcales bacterium]|nr:ACT domain-containing protein [Micrococcales bacterium]
MRRSIAGGTRPARRLNERARAYHGADDHRPDPTAALIADASSRITVLEVRAHDRAGLLYWVTSALAQAGFNVDGAKVSTLGSEVVDVFFLTDESGCALSERRAVRPHWFVGASLDTPLEAPWGWSPARVVGVGPPAVRRSSNGCTNLHGWAASGQGCCDHALKIGLPPIARPWSG